MARIKLGATVVGIRGTIGGVTFSANKSGPFARSWSKPSNPRTEPQGANRALLSTHGPFWKNLSAANRTAWNAYAALPAQALTDSLGQTYYVSGFNWYCSCSQNLIDAGRARIATAPTIAVPAAPTITLCNVVTPISVATHYAIGFASGHFTGFDIVVFASWAPGTLQMRASRGFRLVYAGLTTSLIRLYAGLEYLGALGQPTLGTFSTSRIYKQTVEGRRSAGYVHVDPVDAAP